MNLKRNISLRGPLAVTSVWLWLVLIFIFFKVDPTTVKNILIQNMYVPMLLLVFITLLLSLWVIVRSKKISLLWSITVVVFLLLKLYQVGHILNVLLLAGIAISAHLVIVIENKHHDTEPFN